MALSISLATQIGALFLLVVVGYVLVKTGVLKARDASILSKLVLYMCAPAAIIIAFQIELTASRMQGFLLALGAAVGVHILYFGVVGLLDHFWHYNAMEKASMIYSNCGNLILPLVTLVLGQKMVFYASGYMMVQTILLWTHCKTIMSGDAHFEIRHILLNVNMVAIALGIILCITHIHLPTMLYSALNSAQNPMGPLSMLVVGMLLSEMNMKEAFTNKRVYIISFFRLILLPALFLAIIVLFHIHNLFVGADKVLMISLLAASGPSASTVTQFASIYHNEEKESSLINAMTVIFCLFTMPLLNMVYSLAVGL